MKTMITLKNAITFFALMLATVTVTYAQPANDLIENAIDLGYGPIPFTHAAVDFPNATNTNDHTPGGTGCALSSAGVWYKFTATKVGTVNAGILNPNGAVVIFFQGPASGVTSGMQLTHVNQGNNPCASGPLASIQTTIGTTYYIYMRNTVVSDVGIDTSNTFKVPDNDLIENAINMNDVTMPYVEENIHFLMATNTNDGGQMGCPSGNIPGIWYKVTPQQNGQISAQLSSPNGNSALVIYESFNPDATTGIQLTWVDQDLNPCDFTNFAIVDAEVGKTYYFFVASGIAYSNLIIDTSLVLSTVTNEFFDFNYYPNPVVDQLNFSAKSTVDSIKLYNLLGQMLVNQTVSNTSGSVDMRSLPKGMYLAEITASGVKSTVKILKK
jgi:hypothetical protein